MEFPSRTVGQNINSPNQVLETDRDATNSTKGSSTQIQVDDTNPAMKSTMRKPTVFFRRRSVMLKAALAVSVAIITVTIITVIIFSNQEIPEATDNVMSGHVSANKEHQTTILESNPIGKVNEQEDHTEGIDVNDSDYLPTTDSTTHPSSTGNGSGHSNIEETTERTEIGSGDFPLTEDSQEGSGRGLF